MSELRQALELAIKALKNSTPRPREGDDDYAEQGFLEHFAVLSVLQDELTKHFAVLSVLQDELTKLKIRARGIK
jgi:hypothetical protein